MFYVYAHIGKEKKSDGKSNIFYIGKGCGGRAHVEDQRGRAWEKIKNQRGLVVAIVASEMDESSAYSLEKMLISIIRKRGGCEANVSNGGRGGQSKKIYRSDGKVFKNIEIAAEKTGAEMGRKISASHISEAAKGKIKSAYGFAWDYKVIPNHPEDRYIRASKTLGTTVYCSNGMKFHSISSAAKFINCLPSQISNAASMFDLNGYSQCCGHHWSYIGNPIPKKNKRDVYTEIFGKPVCNSNGETFESITMAAEEYTKRLKKNCDPTTIHACLTGRTHNAFGVAWWRKGEEKKEFKSGKDRRSEFHSKKIVMDDEFVFKSQADAASWIFKNIGSKNAQANISACARGVKKSAYSHTWRFFDNENDNKLKLLTGDA